MRRFPHEIAAVLAILNLAGCAMVQKPWWEQRQKSPDRTDSTMFGRRARSQDSIDSTLDSSTPEDKEVARVKGEVEDLLARLDGAHPKPAIRRDFFADDEQTSSRSSRRRTAAPDSATAAANTPLSTDAYTGENSPTATAMDEPPSPRIAPRVGGVSVRANSFDMNNAYVSADSSANYPVSTDAPLETSTLDRMIEILEERIQRNPDNVDDQWSLQMLRIAAGRTNEAGYFPTMTDRQTADLLQKAVHTALAARRSADHPDQSARIALDAIDELRQTLLTHADLEIPTVALCRKVTTFGVYDPIPTAALRPNRSIPVIVYSELENFQSKKRDDDFYQTLLSSRLEIFDGTGQSIWNEEQPKIEDLARQRRQDFFMAQLVEFPPMPPGSYTLKVTVTDTLSGRMNQAIHNFTIASTTAQAP